MAKQFQRYSTWDLYDAIVGSALFAVTAVGLGWVAWEAIGDPIWRFAK